MSLPRIFFSGWTFVGKEKAQLSPVKLPSSLCLGKFSLLFGKGLKIIVNNRALPF